MAEEETINEQQPEKGAENAEVNAEANTEEPVAESSADPSASEATGADAAPPADEAEAEAGVDAEAAGDDAAQDSAETPKSAAEKLANEALQAAQSAVDSLDEDTASVEDGESGPVEAPSSQSQAPASSAATGNGSAIGSTIGSGAAATPMPFTPEQLTQLASIEGGEGIDILSDVDLNVKIELGRTKMLVEDVLKLTDGAVVELDKLAGDPVDIYVNDRHVARGEVLILNDNFCVRVSEILEASIEER